MAPNLAKSHMSSKVYYKDTHLQYIKKVAGECSQGKVFDKSKALALDLNEKVLTKEMSKLIHVYLILL